MLTGARGFLGHALTDVFCRIPGCRVFAVDRYALAESMGAAPARPDPQIEHVDQDVTKPLGIIPGPIDYILSLAGIASPAHYKKRPLETLDVGILGLRNMLDLARERKARILFSSSSELVGDPAIVPTPETCVGAIQPMRPRSAYDLTKLLGENLCWVYSTYFGVKATVVRLFNSYGPPMGPSDFRVMSRFAYNIVHGKPTTVFGDGDQTRTFCYVTDTLFGILLALLDGELGPYNVGAEVPEISMTRLAELFERVSGRAWTIEHVSPPSEYLAEPRRRCPDLSKIKMELGYVPEVSLEEGVHRFLAWTAKAYR